MEIEIILGAMAHQPGGSRIHQKGQRTHTEERFPIDDLRCLDAIERLKCDDPGNADQR